MRRTVTASAALATVSAIALATAAEGAGFYIAEQSVAGLGRAFGGEVTMSDDASVFWYNPALAVDIPCERRVRFCHEVAAGVSFLAINGDYTDNGSAVTRPNLPASSIAGSLITDTRATGGPDGDDPVPLSYIPYLHLMWSLSEDTKLGLSFNAPFGLDVEYPVDWFGRYDSTNSELATYNLQASVSQRINSVLSVGAGFNVQYADVTLQQAIPNPLAYNPITFAPVVQPDGSLTIQGDDISFGYNVGVTVRPISNFTIGAHYRSGMKHEGEGTLTFAGLDAPDAIVGAGPAMAFELLNGAHDMSAPLNLPDIGSLGVAYELTDAITFFAQSTYFGWSNFKGINIASDAVVGNLSTTYNYKDTINVGGGAEIEVLEPLTVRAGVQWDPTPTNNVFGSTRVPDSDRIWLTGGVSYEIWRGARLDGSLAYVLYKDRDVTRTESVFAGTQLQTATSLNASTEGDALIGAIGIVFPF